MSVFTQKDLDQLAAKGITTKKVSAQLENFATGFPFADITAPATAANGVLQVSEAEIKHYESRYDANTADEKIVKFVPASGAASRMFQAVFEFMNSYSGDTSFLENKNFASPSTFFNLLEKFAFYEDLKTAYEKQFGSFKRADYVNILKTLLTEIGLNYGNLPKGLLKFHPYKGHSRTSAEEHLVEAALYGASQGAANVHFTVSPEHKKAFSEHVESVKNVYERAFGITLNIEFSVQKPSTDTVAGDEHNEPFRNSDGSMLFRPGGHGALIENLNDIDADVIFIKNIDNIVPDRLKDTTVSYKKIIGGILVDLRDKLFAYIKLLKSKPSAELQAEILNFFAEKLFYTPEAKFASLNFEARTAYLLQKLNRPIRVCGMVKNEGEPGGGPFFVRNSKGDIGLQIVESSQIDFKNPAQKQLADSATHFNPVDLVCAVKDYTGKKFDLRNFIDEETGFISEKSKDGKKLKAQELPGLWNGAMADWNTLFVEVPIITFNPVKIVNDLLREQHQG
jgi:hypothetical protein